MRLPCSCTNQAIINNVIAQTQGIPFYPLNAPNVVMDNLAAFGGTFEGVETLLDRSQAVNYLAMNRALLETVIPLNNSATAQLTPDIVTPGGDPRPGKIVGALFQPSRGTMVVVAVFKPEGFTCGSNCEPPEKVRFYYNNTQYYENSIVYGEFVDPDGDGRVTEMEEGAVISHKHSCVTVGLEQVCWEPYDHNIVRDEPQPKDVAYDAYTRFKDVYDLQVDFYVDDAVPDIIGQARRDNCRYELRRTTNLNRIKACRPNVVFTAAKDTVPGQPVGIMVVLNNAPIRTYRASNGELLSSLPVGEYLMMDATAHVTIPGQVGALFLVNADTQNHYIIPSMVMQGFAYSDAIDERHVGIKDGYVWGRCYGW